MRIVSQTAQMWRKSRIPDVARAPHLGFEILSKSQMWRKSAQIPTPRVRPRSLNPSEKSLHPAKISQRTQFGSQFREPSQLEIRIKRPT